MILFHLHELRPTVHQLASFWLVHWKTSYCHHYSGMVLCNVYLFCLVDSYHFGEVSLNFCIHGIRGWGKFTIRWNFSKEIWLHNWQRYSKWCIFQTLVAELKTFSMMFILYQNWRINMHTSLLILQIIFLFYLWQQHRFEASSTNKFMQFQSPCYFSPIYCLSMI